MKILEKFNYEDTYLIISGYPERGRNAKNYGIAWYTKETIKPLASQKNARFVILAETNDNNEPKIYQDGKILVLRVFDQRHPTLYPRILRWLSVFSRIKQVFVHSEFGANGGIKNFALLIPFLLLIKLTGRKITYFAHNVVENFNSLAPHLNIKKGSLKLKILNLAIKAYDFALGKVTDRIVVLDPAIRKRIVKYVGKNKVLTTLMPVKERKDKLSRKKARKKLGIKNNEFVLLYFGFITWYKGADWLINKIKNEKLKMKNLRLILAGGPAYSLKDQKYYQKFYQKQLDTVKDNPNITITGFVPEAEISKYFAAADLVVFPYREMIGASGAFTYALSYHKSFILSTGLSPILKSPDFAEGLKKFALCKKDLVFGLNKKSFFALLKKYQNKSNLARLKKLSSFIAQERSYRRFLNDYFNQIYGKSLERKPSFSRSLLTYVHPQPEICHS